MGIDNAKNVVPMVQPPQIQNFHMGTPGRPVPPEIYGPYDQKPPRISNPFPGRENLAQEELKAGRENEPGARDNHLAGILPTIVETRHGV